MKGEILHDLFLQLVREIYLYDNAISEAPYKIIKIESVNYQIFETQEQLGYEFADYVN